MPGADLPMAPGTTRLPTVPRPLLLVVSPEPAMARSLEHGLRRVFGPRGFEAACVDSAAAALESIRAMRDEDRALALLLADQELPESSGVALMASARELFRELRTVLLIDYADMDAALDALSAGVLDYFFIKPLGPPDDQLAPIVSDLLGDWRRWEEETAKALRVVGARHSEEAHRLRDFLRRNDIHHHFLDVDHDEEARLLLGTSPHDGSHLPLVVLSDGSRLERPSPLDLARRLGLPTRAARSSYDLAIVGGGPAGLAAAVYAASEGLQTVVIEREAPGGQAGQSSRIENYLGFPSGLKGLDLAQRAVRQSRRFKAEIVRLQEVESLEVDGRCRAVRLSDGSRLECRVAVIACGVTYRKLEAPGVEELLGRGVFYGAAMTEAEEAGGQHVFIVGGANSAGQAALHFAQYARRVTIVVRAASLDRGMSRYLVERIMDAPNIQVRAQATIAAVAGERHLEEVTLLDSTTGETETLPADGVFIFIGAVPHTGWLEGIVARDDRGFILSGRDLGHDSRLANWPLDRDPYLLETSVPGVFVAGDVRHGSLKRVASAVGEGAMAVQFIHEYLAELRDD